MRLFRADQAAHARHWIRRLRLVAPLATGALVFTLVPGSPANADPTDPAAMAAEINAAQQQLNALNSSVDQAVEAYNQAQLALGQARAKADDAKARVAAAKASYATLQRGLSTIAAAAYRTGGTDQVVLMMTSDPGDYLDKAAALDRVSQAQSDAIRQVQASRLQLEQTQESAGQAVASTQHVADTLAAEKRGIEAKVGQQEQLVTQLKAKQAELIRIAEQKRAEAARLAQERASRAAARAAAEAAAAEAAAARVSQSTSGPSGPPPTYNGPASGRAAVAVRFAYAQLGKPYQWGGAGPNSYDCSGLTMRAWGAAGVALTHSAADQYNEGTHIPTSALQPGDLVFFGHPIEHVGIYIGNGKMIDAPHTGAYVRIEGAFWSDYVGASRPG
jgi:cell wall-associated NlpC family hydrolase